MPVIHVLYTVLKSPLQQSVFDCCFGQLPLFLQEKIIRLKRWQDAHASLLGKMMLKSGLTEHYGARGTVLEELKFTAYNRPFLPNSNVDFNISHSAEVIVCAIGSNVRVGIDVEEIKPVAVNDFQEQFSPEEMRLIQKADDSYTKFYSYWTKKEAIIKANGMGLSAPLKSILINEAEGEATLLSEKWFLNGISLMDNYCCCLAIDRKVKQSEIAVEFVSFAVAESSKNENRALDPVSI